MTHRRARSPSWLFTPVVAALAAIATVAPPTAVEAQQLRYTTVNELELGGQLGKVMSMLPGMGDPTRETVWISGSRMRTDVDNSSTIVDLEEGRFINIDHGSRSYFTMDLATFGERMAEVQRRMKANMGEAEQAMAEARAEMEAAREERAEMGHDDAEMSLDVQISTERTGRTRDLAGLEAEQVFMILEMRAENAAEAADPEMEELKEGKMVLLTELWLTDEPLQKLPEDFDVEQFEEMTAGSLAGLEQIFMSQPDLKVALDRSRAELEDLQGHALESSMSWVIVPPGEEFDREKAMAWEPEGVDVKGGAADAAKGAMRRSLGGLFGGGDEEEEEEEKELEQVTFLRVTTTLEDIVREEIPASAFEVPEGYTEREMPGMGMGGSGGGR